MYLSLIFDDLPKDCDHLDRMDAMDPVGVAIAMIPRLSNQA